MQPGIEFDYKLMRLLGAPGIYVGSCPLPADKWLKAMRVKTGSDGFVEFRALPDGTEMPATIMRICGPIRLVLRSQMNEAEREQFPIPDGLTELPLENEIWLLTGYDRPLVIAEREREAAV